MSDGAAFLRAMANASPGERAYFKALSQQIQKAKDTEGTPEYIDALRGLHLLTGGGNAYPSIYDNPVLNNVMEANGLDGIA